MVLSSAETSSKVFLVVAPVAEGDFGTHCLPRAVLWLGLFAFLGSFGYTWRETTGDLNISHILRHEKRRTLFTTFASMHSLAKIQQFHKDAVGQIKSMLTVLATVSASGPEVRRDTCGNRSKL